MKKIFIGLISLALIISLDFGNLPLASGKSLRIAMVLWRGGTEGEQGFKDGLSEELVYSVDYTIMNVGQEREELRRILDNQIAPKLNDLDYIYTFGTTASKMTKIFIHDRVPQPFNVVFAPVESGIVRSIEKTGATDA